MMDRIALFYYLTCHISRYRHMTTVPPTMRPDEDFRADAFLASSIIGCASPGRLASFLVTLCI